LRERKFSEKIRRTLEKLRDKDSKECKGYIIILGPSPTSNTKGAKIRNKLKDDLNKHIVSLGDFDLDIEINAYFPEDVEDDDTEIDLVDEQRLFIHNDTKIIFGIWSEDAQTIRDEVSLIARFSNSARRLIVFIDKKLWNKRHFNIEKGELNNLEETFDTVYIVDFDKDEKFIFEKSIKIFNKHHKWAKNHFGQWPNDTIISD